MTSLITLIDSLAAVSSAFALLALLLGRHKRHLSDGNLKVITTILFLTFIHDFGNILEWSGMSNFLDVYIEEPLKIVLSTFWLFFFIIALRDIEIIKHNNTKYVLNKNIKNLASLIELTYDLTSTTEPKELYRKIILIGKQLLDLDFSTIMLLTEDKKKLVIKDTLGFPQYMIDTFYLVSGQGLSTYVVKTMKPATVYDFKQEKRFEVPPIVHEKNISSAICAPMIFEGEVFGVLIGHTYKKRIFNKEEIILYQSLANEAAVAIKNAFHVEELKKEKAHSKALLEAIPDLIVRVDKEGKIKSFKPSNEIKDIFSDTDPTEKSLDMLLPKELTKQYMSNLAYSLRTHESVQFSYSLEIRGRKRFFESNIVPYTDTEVIIIVRDITSWVVNQEELKKHKTNLEELVEQRTAELKRRLEEIELLNRGMLNLLEDLQIANQKLQETTKRLAESNRELEAFAYSVSHDLRAPLRAMQGFSEALLEDYADKLDETGIEYARRIKEAAERMDNLILDLLTYSRITRSEIRHQPIDLGGVIKEVIESLKDLIEETGAVIETPTSLPVVKATHSIAVQIFSNLINNAIKFSRPGIPPHIKIYHQQIDENRIRVFIKDNGIGIPKEHHERIFRIFERLHGIETYPGTGIGLAIVKRGAEKIGGSVGLESEPNKGSTFWVDFILWNQGGFNNESPGSNNSVS